jgi:hypothetical protein
MGDLMSLAAATGTSTLSAAATMGTALKMVTGRAELRVQGLMLDNQMHLLSFMMLNSFNAISNP